MLTEKLWGFLRNRRDRALTLFAQVFSDQVTMRVQLVAGTTITYAMQNLWARSAETRGAKRVEYLVV